LNALAERACFSQVGGGRFSDTSLPTVAAIDAGLLNGREVATDGLAGMSSRRGTYL
jgi:hypothetical protein